MQKEGQKADLTAARIKQQKVLDTKRNTPRYCEEVTYSEFDVRHQYDD